MHSEQTAATAPLTGDGLAVPISAAQADLLRRWMSLSELKRRSLRALADELSTTSDFVERAAGELSQEFLDLARLAGRQTALVADLERLAGARLPADGAALSELPGLLAKIAEASAHVARHIDALVVEIQFQDRTRQHLLQIGDTLLFLADAGAVAQAETHGAVPDLSWDGSPDPALLARLLDAQRLSEMRGRLLAHLVPDAAPQEDQALGGSIDLF
jgi:hypothetical protein